MKPVVGQGPNCKSKFKSLVEADRKSQFYSAENKLKIWSISYTAFLAEKKNQN